MDSARREIVVRIIQLVTEQLKGVERRLRPVRGSGHGTAQL